MVDITGKEIVVGDVVTYASRKHSSVWLQTCVVLRQDETKGLVLQNVWLERNEDNIVKHRVFGKPYYYKSMSKLAVIS